MTVVDQLDQSLFDKFLQPKVTIATGKLRGGILDPEMDWYETPQPTGESVYATRARHVDLAPPWRARIVHAAAFSPHNG